MQEDSKPARSASALALVAALLAAGCGREKTAETYPNGKPKVIRTYGWFGGATPGNMTREQTFFFNDRRETDARYRKGKLHGPYQDFRHNGQKKSQGRYEAGKKAGEWEFYYNEFSVSSRGRFRDDRKEGPWNAFWENGALKSSGTFSAGKETGTWKEWNDKGGLMTENSCFESNDRGRYASFHASNTLKEEYACRKGVPEGAYVRKDADGEVVERGAFDAQGRKHGAWEAFHPGGKKASLVNYANGMEHDSAFAWDAAGRLRERAFSDSGNGERLAYDSLGRLTDRKRFVQGVPEGEFWTYWPQGAKRSLVVYKQGKPQELRKWHANGRPMTGGLFVNGRRSGEWKDFWSNGMQKEVANYQGGNLHGERAFHDEQGKLLRTQRYEHGYPAEGKIPAAVARGGITEGTDLAERARRDNARVDKDARPPRREAKESAPGNLKAP